LIVFTVSRRDSATPFPADGGPQDQVPSASQGPSSKAIAAPRGPSILSEDEHVGAVRAGADDETALRTQNKVTGTMTIPETQGTRKLTFQRRRFQASVGPEILAMSGGGATWTVISSAQNLLSLEEATVRTRGVEE